MARRSASPTASLALGCIRQVLARRQGYPELPNARKQLIGERQRLESRPGSSDDRQPRNGVRPHIRELCRLAVAEGRLRALDWSRRQEPALGGDSECRNGGTIAVRTGAGLTDLRDGRAKAL